MRRIDKDSESLIIKENLSYKGKGRDSRLSSLLYDEQNHLCAYTEEYIGRADRGEIEHFDPNLKFSDEDGYLNWFLVKAQWNSEKGDKRRWNKFQPLMHPTAEDFETRILYDKGRYILANENDIEARNLRDYLKLDDEELAKQRVNYILRLKSDLILSGLSNQEFIDTRLVMYRNDIYYIRAIEEELQVKVNFDLIEKI
ncbi:hypothetical protein GCM10028803_52610 [Larkinella knui]|uniref:HNH nuclease domain-containing protein n=1 Tax=Larkinella knui TaxID=2025310 RepID=A0A3P1CH55_9BACT|nr:hypothetical protein [Larkinella knui]RRB12528.1 hypothetical protein EHT87_20240 [Larkinella knui]